MKSKERAIVRGNSARDKMLSLALVSGTAAMSLLLAACSGTKGGNGNGGSGAATDTAGTVYQAELKALNTAMAPTSARGRATIRVKGDSMLLSITASGLEPGTMHQAYFFGFPGGQDAACATMDQDMNNDGVIDIVETRAVSGVALIPFNDNPVGLDLTAQTFPEADEQGALSYKKTVSVKELRNAIKNKFGTDSLQLDQGVIYLHGVSQNAKLPESVQSLPGVPAHATLPVACGALQKKGGSWLPF